MYIDIEYTTDYTLYTELCYIIFILHIFEMICIVYLLNRESFGRSRANIRLKKMSSSSGPIARDQPH